MSMETVIRAIDSEIENLQQAKRLLNGAGPVSAVKASPAPSKSRFSEATRQKMARAQRARWKKRPRTEAQPTVNEGA